MEPVKSARKTTMNLCFKVLLVSSAWSCHLFATICTCSNVYNVPTNIVMVLLGVELGGCGYVEGVLLAKGEWIHFFPSLFEQFFCLTCSSSLNKRKEYLETGAVNRNGQGASVESGKFFISHLVLCCFIPDDPQSTSPSSSSEISPQEFILPVDFRQVADNITDEKTKTEKGYESYSLPRPDARHLVYIIYLIPESQCRECDGARCEPLLSLVSENISI